MQIAAKVPFHPQECPTCQYYVKAGEQCRTFNVDSAPRLLLEILVGETNKPCEHFLKISAPLPAVQPFVTPPGTKICSSCTSHIPIEEKTCPHCGAWFDVTIKGYCPNCQVTVQASGNRWCCRCGGELTDPRVESKVVEQPATPTVEKTSPVDQIQAV